MFFIFGKRTTTGNPIQTSLDCPACSEERSIIVVPEQHYFQIFGIPLFPTVKKFTPVCSLCGATFTTQRIPVTEEVRKQYKPPKWTMLGTMILGALVSIAVIFIVFTLVSRKSDLESKVEAPRIGDVYHVGYSEHQYSLMKVVSFTSDSVFFYLSPGRIDNRADLDKLAEMDAYDTLEKKGFSKKELRKNSLPEMKILEIKR